MALGNQRQAEAARVKAENWEKAATAAVNSKVNEQYHTYEANDFGLYNTCGNVAEAVGGSWNDPGYDVRVESTANYTGASPFVGFRPVLVVKEE